MKVLYICFADFSRADSGSSVRPQKMYKAFLERGHEVKLLCGSDGNDCRKERKKNVAEINSWLNSEKPDICYIESPTGAIMLDCDIRLIKRIHRMGIPIGYFMRDFHSKFPEVFPRRKGFVNSLKDLYLNIRQKKTFAVLNNVDIVYLPSEESKYLFEYRDMRELSPAGENKISDTAVHEQNCIYVGGVKQQYSFEDLLNTFAELNSNGLKYRLIACVRKNEWKIFDSKYKNAPWLDIYHVSGTELEPLYEKASIAIISPQRGNTYNDVAISVKLYEYMSYGLPIVSLDSPAMSRIIKKYELGIVSETPKQMAESIRFLLNDAQEYSKYKNNVKKALLSENLWVHRVDTVVQDLSEKTQC